jgi:hypothetical protein
MSQNTHLLTLNPSLYIDELNILVTGSNPCIAEKSLLYKKRNVVQKCIVIQSLFTNSNNKNVVYIPAAKENQSLAGKAYLKVELDFVDPIFIEN